MNTQVKNQNICQVTVGSLSYDFEFYWSSLRPSLYCTTMLFGEKVQNILSDDDSVFGAGSKTQKKMTPPSKMEVLKMLHPA